MNLLGAYFIIAIFIKTCISYTTSNPCSLTTLLSCLKEKSLVYKLANAESSAVFLNHRDLKQICSDDSLFVVNTCIITKIDRTCSRLHNLWEQKYQRFAYICYNWKGPRFIVLTEAEGRYQYNRRRTYFENYRHCTNSTEFTEAYDSCSDVKEPKICRKWEKRHTCMNEVVETHCNDSNTSAATYFKEMIRRSLQPVFDLHRCSSPGFSLWLKNKPIIKVSVSHAATNSHATTTRSASSEKYLANGNTKNTSDMHSVTTSLTNSVAWGQESLSKSGIATLENFKRATDSEAQTSEAESGIKLAEALKNCAGTDSRISYPFLMLLIILNTHWVWNR